MGADAIQAGLSRIIALAQPYTEHATIRERNTLPATPQDELQVKRSVFIRILNEATELLNELERARIR